MERAARPATCLCPCSPPTQRAQRLVQNVELLAASRGNLPNTVAIAVKTSGGADLVVSMLKPEPVVIPFGDGDVATDGRFAAIVSRDGQAWRACLAEGSQLKGAGVNLRLPISRLHGEIVGVGGARGDSYFVVGGRLPENLALAGQTFFAIDHDSRRAYPIVAIEAAEGGLRVFTKRGGRGFEARPARRWELPLTAEALCGRNEDAKPGS